MAFPAAGASSQSPEGSISMEYLIKIYRMKNLGVSVTRRFYLNGIKMLIQNSVKNWSQSPEGSISMEYPTTQIPDKPWGVSVTRRFYLNGMKTKKLQKLGSIRLSHPKVLSQWNELKMVMS